MNLIDQSILYWECYLLRHEDLMSHGLQENYRVASAKLKTESLSHPHIILYNSSSFKGHLCQSFLIHSIFTSDELKHCSNGHSNRHINGSNGHVNGSNGSNGHTNGHSNGSNGHTNGHSNGSNGSRWTSGGEMKIR